MSITRDPNNLYGVVEYTDIINDLDRQFSLVPDGVISMENTTQTAIVFDKDDRTTTLIPSVNRNSRGATYNQDENFETYSLPLAYFKHIDYLYPEDVRSVRLKGTPDTEKQLATARAEKIEKMRREFDQTMEYMKFRCLTEGLCVSPNGVVFADMFDEFNETQTTITWDLTDAAFDLGAEMRKLKRLMRDNLKNGGVMREPTVYLESSDYDAVVGLDSIKEAYRFYQASPSPERDDIVDSFRHAGVTMIALDGAFNLPDGTTHDIMTEGTGYAVPLINGIIRGYAGPHNKLPNFPSTQGIQDVYLWEKLDDEGESWKYTMEAAPLFVHTKPTASIKITVVK